MMIRSKIQRYFILTILFVAVGCKNEQSPVPRGINPITLDLNLPIFSSFDITQSIFITGGASGLGIVVYRMSQDEFRAYDRMCPSTSHSEWIKLLKSENSMIIMECPNCGSKFNLIDGSIIEGPAQFYMSEYQTYYYKETNILVITN